jgi:hypothetical protein
MATATLDTRTCPRSGRPLRFDPAFNAWTTGPLMAEMAPPPAPACCPPDEAEPCTACTDHKPRRPRKAADPAPRVATLTLTLCGVDYRIRPIANEITGGRAYRIRRVDSGAVYDLAETEHGPSCDCPDATYRERECKHVAAARLFGLL